MTLIVPETRLGCSAAGAECILLGLGASVAWFDLQPIGMSVPDLILSGRYSISISSDLEWHVKGASCHYHCDTLL